MLGEITVPDGDTAAGPHTAATPAPEPAGMRAEGGATGSAVAPERPVAEAAAVPPTAGGDAAGVPAVQTTVSGPPGGSRSGRGGRWGGGGPGGGCGRGGGGRRGPRGGRAGPGRLRGGRRPGERAQRAGGGGARRHAGTGPRRDRRGRRDGRHRRGAPGACRR